MIGTSSPWRLRWRRLALGFLALVCLTAHADFSVSGRRILRDGSPFFAQGVCYQPTPIGNDGANDRRLGAYARAGDFFTADCAALHDRDLPLLRGMGANVLRVYGWNSSLSHTAFLDRCYNGGSQPLFLLLNLWIDPATDWTSATAVVAIAQRYVALDASVANHPAVLGILIGNEVNAQNGNGAKPAFWAAMNTIAQTIKTANPSRLVSVAVTDALPQVQANNASLPVVDFWSMQIYRHPAFGSFFADYAAVSAKPLLLSEFGLDAYDHANSREYLDNAAFVGERLASLWGEIFDASAGAGAVCSGGCVFEYSDEWYKADTEGWMRWQHDAGGYAAPWLPDGWGDEEWWGLFAVALTDGGASSDTLAARAGVARLTALWTAPPLRIVTQPQALLVRVGTVAQLSFSTVSPLATTCEWRRDGNSVTGGADGVLRFSAVNWSDAGSYQARAVTSAGAVTSNAATVLVHDEAYASYEAWAAAAFSVAELAAKPAIADATADPDGTGVPNLLRYAFKELPLRGPLGVAPVHVATVAVGGVNYAELRFARKTYDPKLQYVVETGTDLVGWATWQTLSAGNPAAVALRYPAALGTESRRFFRVRVELVP
jgi:hypothetical protein